MKYTMTHSLTIPHKPRPLRRKLYALRFLILYPLTYRKAAVRRRAHKRWLQNGGELEDIGIHSEHALYRKMCRDRHFFRRHWINALIGVAQ